MASKPLALEAVIAAQTQWSRRKILVLLTDRKIKVNGVIATSLSQPITAKDKVVVDGTPLQSSAPVFHYYKFNKPRQVLSTMSDPQGRKCVGDFLKDLPPGVVPVGRLDRDTTGLLFFTNDGQFANQVAHPRFGLSKTYVLNLDRPLTKNDIRRVVTGFILDDGPVVFTRCEHRGEATYSVTIKEGRNRIVRRSFAHLGYEVKTLKRTSIGPVLLGKLEEGTFKPLTKADREAIELQLKQPNT
ncbi:MAG: pseudouridine synthase [Candidatus Margulisiibacteriota bacterium]